MSATDLALLALLTPLVTAGLLAVAYPVRKAGKPAAWLSLAAATVSLGASIQLFVSQVGDPAFNERALWIWLPHGGEVMATIGVHLDGTSVSMALIVSFVAWCVQVFSLGYMGGEPKAAFGRYYAYHSLFIFSMLTLVFAPNMLQFFAGWELVGLTSYLLIGFYYEKPSAARAAVKAFWMTKLADMGLLIGLLVLFALTGGFEWTANLEPFWANVVTLLFFLGVMGKSAQFPLHVWLPDAMEGPTPVSALLHAATMVAAGVYLVVRANPLFAQAETTLMVMTYIGGFTALFAAIIAVVQTDIKKVLAYSTCSQLGYMVAALGAGSVMGGYFHLTTHAFFKALLFLGAGALIHAVHSNELKDMGGLFKKLKVTGAVFVIGSLALAGFPGFAGFFSKDLILEALYEQQLWVPYAFLMTAVFLTAFYMGRVVFPLFFDEPSEAVERAHPPGLSMLVPLVLLAIPALGAGYFASSFAEMNAVAYEFHLGVTGYVAIALTLSGIGLSYLVYGKKSVPLSTFAALEPIGRLARSGAVDKVYQTLFTDGALYLAGAIGWFDRYVIDGVMNWVAWLFFRGGEKLRRLQTGNVRDYVFALVIALIAVSGWSILQ